MTGFVGLPEGASVLVAPVGLPEGAAPGDEDLLSADERERGSRFANGSMRRRWVAGRAGLRRLLGTLLDVPPDSITLAYGAKGKPHLAPPFDRSGLRFSLTHSGAHALVAVARGREVGIDLERIRDLRDGPAVARRWFSDEECAVLAPLAGPAWHAAFFRIWTRKEAFVKAVGEGLSFGTRRFAVSHDATARLVHVDGEVATAARWSLADVEAPEGYLAAVCVEGPVDRVASIGGPASS